jgi:MFS family permease
MEDLRINLKTTTGNLVWTTTAFIYVYTIACGMAYFTLDRFNRQLQYCVALVLYSISQLSIPYCTSMYQLTLSMCLGGLASGYTDCISLAWVIELFRQKTRVYLLIAYFTVAVGITINQNMTAPFLTTLDTSAPDFDIEKATPNPLIKYPFFIISGYLFSCAVLQFISYCCKVSESVHFQLHSNFIFGFSLLNVSFEQTYTGPKRNANTYPFPEERMSLICYPVSAERKKEIAKFEDETYLTDLQKVMYTSDNRELKLYYCVFISLACWNCSIVNFLQGNVSICLPIFLHYHLRLPMPEATMWASVSNITTCVVVFVFIFVAFRINHYYMLYTNFVIMMVGHLIMAFAAHLSKTWLTVAVIMMGFGANSSYPLMLAFIESRITVTNSISSLQCLATSFLISFNPILFGNNFVRDPLFFMWVNIGAIAMLIITFILMHMTDLWLKQIENKFRKTSE